MQEQTKTLCYWAAQLYHTDRISANMIFDKLLNSKSRLKEVAQAKQLVGYILYNHFGYTLQKVATELNLINHTTIIYWLDKMQVQLRNNKRMQYRYDFMKDILDGKEREIIRQKTNIINKNILSEADMQFIKSTIKHKYSVCYYSDVLKKNRHPIRDYIKILSKELNIFETPKFNNFKVVSFKSNSIDY